MLKGKHILLGLTGSIAAYKAAVILRLLVKEGAEVKVIMTSLSKEFITPLTMSTLSGNPIFVEFFNPENGDWNSHVDLGLWADIYLIAPATANTIAKMAQGIADNLLLTTYLSARCPVFVSPAMDIDMLQHPATQKNIKTLQSFGNIIIEPTTGYLASGLEGKGRMEDPEKIVEIIHNYFSVNQKLAGKKILVTAGPTVEQIDPVRFISNHSSGKMGYAIAEKLADMGAQVLLISGPVHISLDHINVKTVKVTSAVEMHDACISEFPNCDAAIMVAAVADYTAVQASKQKIKRTGQNLTVELKPNPDIATELGKIKKANQVLAGFALETCDILNNASQKMINKNFDFIVINSLEAGSGFNTDTNKISIVDKNNKIEHFKLKSKKDAAKDIADKLCEFFDNTNKA